MSERSFMCMQPRGSIFLSSRLSWLRYNMLHHNACISVAHFRNNMIMGFGHNLSRSMCAVCHFFVQQGQSFSYCDHCDNSPQLLHQLKRLRLSRLLRHSWRNVDGNTADRVASACTEWLALHNPEEHLMPYPSKSELIRCMASHSSGAFCVRLPPMSCLVCCVGHWAASVIYNKIWHCEGDNRGHSRIQPCIINLS